MIPVPSVLHHIHLNEWTKQPRSRPTSYTDETSLMLRTFDFPDLDDTGSIATNNPASEWRVDASQNRDDVLMSLQKVLLVMGNQRHSLRRSVDLARSRRRSRPGFDMNSCIPRGFAHSAGQGENDGQH